MLIALAIAGVVGIIMFFVVSSGSSGDEQKQEAGAALRQLFDTCLKNDERQGLPLVDARQVLAVIQQKRMKEWNTFDQKEKDELTAQAWRMIRVMVLKDLKLEGQGAAQVDVLLSGADVDYVPSRGEVTISWTFLGETWRSRLRREGQIAWVVFEFRKVQ